MYELGDIALVVGITLGIVIIANVMIVLYVRHGRGKRTGRFTAMGKILKDVRNPWRKEDEQIEELSYIVKTLKENSEMRGK